jgi:hypothetical protein
LNRFSFNLGKLWQLTGYIVLWIEEPKCFSPELQKQSSVAKSKIPIWVKFWNVLQWKMLYSINTVRESMTNILCKVVYVFCHADSCLTCHSISWELFHHAAQRFILM